MKKVMLACYVVFLASVAFGLEYQQLVVLDSNGVNVTKRGYLVFLMDDQETSVNENGQVLMADPATHSFSVTVHGQRFEGCLITAPWREDLHLPYYSRDFKIAGLAPILTIDMRRPEWYPCR